MAFILTFLGKGGIGCTTTAIATAKKYANLGKKVLLVVQDSTPSLSLLMGVEVASTITEISNNLSAIQLQSSLLLENAWEELKKLETKYLRSPVLNNIFAQELALLPGMDEALALNFLREQDQSGKYDIIVYDGKSSLHTVRMLGIPETLSWYIRRVKNLLENSDIIQALSPFIQPLSSAILNVSWSADNFAQQPTNEANQILDQGKTVVNDPHRMAAFLITNDTPESIVTARYWWGSAQQVGLTVGGVLLNQREITPEIEESFPLLTINSIPDIQRENIEELSASLPDFQKQALKAPSPLTIDTDKREIRIFLPGFEKKQVKLSQSGPEITISAGDQRRNILLPIPLKGQPVKGAKFQDAYLIVSL